MRSLPVWLITFVTVCLCRNDESLKKRCTSNAGDRLVKCYYLYKSPDSVTWSTACTKCPRPDQTMATIDDEQDNQTIVKLMQTLKQPGHGPVHAWIGGKKVRHHKELDDMSRGTCAVLSISDVYDENRDCGDFNQGLCQYDKQQPGDVCDESVYSYIYSADHCYFILNEGGTWQESAERCSYQTMMSTHSTATLATTDLQKDDLLEKIRSHPLGYVDLWIANKIWTWNNDCSRDLANIKPLRWPELERSIIGSDHPSDDQCLYMTDAGTLLVRGCNEDEMYYYICQEMEPGPDVPTNHNTHVGSEDNNNGKGEGKGHGDQDGKNGMAPAPDVTTSASNHVGLKPRGRGKAKGHTHLDGKNSGEENQEGKWNVMYAIIGCTMVLVLVLFGSVLCICWRKELKSWCLQKQEVRSGKASSLTPLDSGDDAVPIYRSTSDNEQSCSPSGPEYEEINMDDVKKLKITHERPLPVIPEEMPTKERRVEGQNEAVSGVPAAGALYELERQSSGGVDDELMMVENKHYQAPGGDEGQTTVPGHLSAEKRNDVANDELVMVENEHYQTPATN